MAKILLPVDFSERSIGAAHHALAVARQFHSQLTMLHVLAPPPYELGGLEALGGAYGTSIEQATTDLNVFLANEAEGLALDRLVVEGDPARKIVETAHNGHYNLIVLPTHGYGPFRRFILGSTTAKVLHDADCPVWTGAHLEQAAATAAPAFHHIVCALDLGSQSRGALCWATQMAAGFGARLTVLHATPPLEVGPARYFDPHWRVELANRAREEITRLMADLGVQGAIHIQSGDPHKLVAEFATLEKADLVVIGRSSAKGILGRLRAVAYAIVRESPCPVVSV
jgi:nucleotide-binding universal stress UspA family protein